MKVTGRKKAQSTVEYAIIIALIAMAAIAVYMALGGQLRNLVTSETNKLATGSDQTVESVNNPDQSSSGTSINNF